MSFIFSLSLKTKMDFGGRVITDEVEEGGGGGGTHLQAAFDESIATQVDGTNIDGYLTLTTTSGEPSGLALSNESKELFHIDPQLAAPKTRFDTTVYPTTDNAHDLGLPAKRWKRMYANDVDTPTITSGAATYTLPTTYNDAEFLKTDGSGNLAFQYLDQNQFATGVEMGGILSVNGVDATTFDISAGSATITDGGVITKMTWNASQQNPIPTLVPLQPGGTPISNINSRIITFVSLGNGGSILLSSERPDAVNRRTYAVLGVLVHTLSTAPIPSNVINVTNQNQTCVENGINQIHDLAIAIGFINTKGNDLGLGTGGGNKILKESGEIFAVNSNSSVNHKDPHTSYLSAVDTGAGGIFQYRNKNGTSSALTLTDFIPNLLDDGSDYNGTTPTLGNQKWGISHVYTFTSGVLKIQPPQFEHATAEDAILNVATEDFVTESSIAANGILIGYIIARGGATLEAAPAVFIKAGKFGTGGGGGTFVDLSSRLAVDGSNSMNGDLLVNGVDSSTKFTIRQADSGLALQVNTLDLSTTAVGLFRVNDTTSGNAVISVDNNGVIIDRETGTTAFSVHNSTGEIFNIDPTTNAHKTTTNGNFHMSGADSVIKFRIRDSLDDTIFVVDTISKRAQIRGNLLIQDTGNNINATIDDDGTLRCKYLNTNQGTVTGGDIYHSGTDGLLKKLPKPTTDGGRLSFESNAPVWKPSFPDRISKVCQTSTTGTIGSSTQYYLGHSTGLTLAYGDVESSWDLTTNYDYTVDAAGVYQISMHIGAQNNAGLIEISIFVNAVEKYKFYRDNSGAGSGTGAGKWVSGTISLLLAVNDVVKIGIISTDSGWQLMADSCCDIMRISDITS